MTDEAIQKWLDERVHIMPQQFFFGAVVRFEDALEAIRLARASEREWVSVETLPHIGTVVFVTDGKLRATAYRYGQGLKHQWVFGMTTDIEGLALSDMIRPQDITHWMLLPEKPVSRKL